MRYGHIIILIASFFSFSCRGENEAIKEVFSQELPSQDRLMRTFIEGNNRFGFEFYHRVKNQAENIFFSPYSLSAGLGLAAAGAKGETADAFKQLFGYSMSLLPLNGDLKAQLSNQGKTGAQVLLADALWVQKDLSVIPSFKLTIEKGLGGSLQLADFATELPRSVQMINSWISQQTRGKILQLLNPQDLSRQTRLVMTTAIYMKGAWAHPFDPAASKRLPFKLSSRTTFSTYMMQTTTSFNLLKGDKWDLLDIPYQKGEEGGELVMTLLLPKESTIEDVEKSFTWENWQQWISKMQMQTVAVTMPIFRMDKRMDLNTPLKSLGLSLPFSPEADFSGITGNKELFLNKAIQKMFITVDEKGTEAAATTGLSMNAATVVEAETPYEFKADHPFLFVLWDKLSGSILFMGRLTTP